MHVAFEYAILQSAASYSVKRHHAMLQCSAQGEVGKWNKAAGNEALKDKFQLANEKRTDLGKEG
jgi:hypothetical protein